MRLEPLLGFVEGILDLLFVFFFELVLQLLVLEGVPDGVDITLILVLGIDLLSDFLIISLVLLSLLDQSLNFLW